MKEIIWTIGCILIGALNGLFFLFGGICGDEMEAKIFAVISAAIELGILWCICHFVFK